MSTGREFRGLGLISPVVSSNSFNFIKKAIAIICAIWIVSLLTGCSVRQVADPPARPALKKEVPRRIVSIAPSTTEVLFALGLEDRIVGVTSQCNYPKEASLKPKIGDYSTNIERVAAAKPDIVVAHGFANRQAVASLRNLKVRVLEVDPKTLDEVSKSIEQIAEGCGVFDRGKRIADEMRASFEGLRVNPAVYKKRPKVLFAVQSAPLWAAPANTYVGEMIERCGGMNIFRDNAPGFSQMSQEVAVAAAPDFIFTTDPGGPAFFKSAKAWKSTPAVRNNRVFVVNGDLYVRPGPRLVDGLREMRSKLLEARN